MSENALLEIASAIRELAAAVRGDGTPVAVFPEARAEVAAAELAKEPASVSVAPILTGEDAFAKAPATYEDLKAAFAPYFAANGRDAAIALLAKVGAKKLPEVAEDRWAELIALLKAA